MTKRDDAFVCEMRARGTVVLKLIGDQLCDTSGKHSFEIVKRHYGQHNPNTPRQEVWFRGPCDMLWTGSQYGDCATVKAKRCTGIRQLMEQLGPKGISINMKDGEYRVNYKHGKEETAYYTNDPVDAFQTGVRMIKQRLGAAKKEGTS